MEGWHVSLVSPFVLPAPVIYSRHCGVVSAYKNKEVTIRYRRKQDRILSELCRRSQCCETLEGGVTFLVERGRNRRKLTEEVIFTLDFGG